MNIYTVKLPDIGEGVVEGEVLEWRKKVDDLVKKDEAVVIVLTDKATVELPSPYAGKFVKQYYKVGDIALVNKPLYDIETSEPVSVSPPVAKDLPKERVLALPETRKLAKEMGIDLEQVPATGKDGRVTTEDLNRFQSKQPPPSIPASRTAILHLPNDEERTFNGLRRVIAEKMAESKKIIPHFSYFDQFNATQLVQLREVMKREAEKEGKKITYMPFFIRALSLALKKYPQFNGSLDLETNSFITHNSHHIGIATKTSLGLVVSVLKDVQEMNFDDLVHHYNALMQKAQDRKLERSDMQGSTITISNFGVFGHGLWATPIINYPEIAILGIAKIRKQAVVEEEQIISQDICNLSWSFDHRVIDGDAAAEFSQFFISLLLRPNELFR